MTKDALAGMLVSNHTLFINQIQQLSDTDFCAAPEGKWSAGQQLDHLIKSVSPVNMAMGLPGFVPRLLFGKANRPSRTYEQLVEKYNLKLQEGGRATGRFVPAPVSAAQKQALSGRLNSLVQKLAAKTLGYSEEALDTYVLPHPLLGKLTLREMLYFTAYHVVHHDSLVKKGLETLAAEAS